MDLILKRTYFNDATIGTLCILGEDNPVWHTLELPNLDNQKNKSCIPEVCYEVKPYSSKNYPNVWELQNVHGRTNILIHVGNFTSNTEGCILIGTGAGYMRDEKAVTNSRVAIEQLREKTDYPNKFNLYIGS